MTLTRLIDTSTSVEVRDNGWPAWESEVSQLVTVIAFVARVRTADGQVWTYDAEKMVPQIQALGLSVTRPDLTPDDQRAINPRSIYWTYYPMQKGSATNATEHARQ